MTIINLIGKTPLQKIEKYQENLSLKANILAKLEYFNPGGSIKDRVGKALIEDAESKGLLQKNSVIIEPTSGNTGIALALTAAVKNYRLILTMPETMSIERRKLLKAYGAELVLTKGSEGMAGAIKKAEELAKELPNSFIPGQFDNPVNPLAHKKTTGPELWSAAEGNIDFLVAGVGTGGTITGAGEFLKEKNPAIKLIAVEPFDSPVLSGGKPGPHAIAGIGAGFVPKILNTKIIDEIIQVKTDEAFAAARILGKIEGILTGISGGAALHAATLLAQRPENAGKNIAVILPDGGEKYLSTQLYEE